MSTEPSIPGAVALGTCSGCKELVWGGDGIVVDAEGATWHPACRKKAAARPKREARS